MALSWYPRYPGDYARKTKHLTMLEHGAYTLLLDHYYSTGVPLLFSNAGSNALLMPDHSRLYRLCGAITKAEQEAVDNVLAMFFTWVDGRGYVNNKADETIEKQTEKHQRRVIAGSKGGRSNAGSNAKAKPKQPEPEPDIDTNVSISNRTQRDVPSSLLMPDGRFVSADQFCQEMWQAYPSVGRRKGHLGKFTEQIKKALKGGESHETIIRGVTDYAKYCHATGQLNKDAERWARDAEWRSDYQIGSPAHRPQQGGQSRQGSGGLAQVIDAGEKAKEMLRRDDEA